MKILSNQYDKYINNPKIFYDLIHLHDSNIINMCFNKNNLQLEIDAQEWEKCNFLLMFSNPKNFYIKTASSTNLFIGKKELIALDFNDCILDFNLIKFNGENYFNILLNKYMHSLLFQADSLEIIKIK